MPARRVRRCPGHVCASTDRGSRMTTVTNSPDDGDVSLPAATVAPRCDRDSARPSTHESDRRHAVHQPIAGQRWAASMSTTQASPSRPPNRPTNRAPPRERLTSPGHRWTFATQVHRVGGTEGNWLLLELMDVHRDAERVPSRLDRTAFAVGVSRETPIAPGYSHPVPHLMIKI